MGILSSKRLRELEMENEDLRNKIHVITEREESLSHLQYTPQNEIGGVRTK